MTIDALKQFGTRVCNVANNTWETAAHTGKSWIKNSPVIYTATALSYYGTLGALSLHEAKWVKLSRGLEPGAAAKITFLVLSSISLMRGLLSQEKQFKLKDLKNLEPILITNGVAISLAVASYLKIKAPVLSALAMTATTAIISVMFSPVFNTK